jgi:hypothetical protein
MVLQKNYEISGYHSNEFHSVNESSVVIHDRMSSLLFRWKHWCSFEMNMCFVLLKSWVTQNFITIKTSWNTNDKFVSNLIYYKN